MSNGHSVYVFSKTVYTIRKNEFTWCLSLKIIDCQVLDRISTRFCIAVKGSILYQLLHSVCKDLTGFIKAAFTAWKLIVATAIIMAPAAEMRNTTGFIET